MLGASGGRVNVGSFFPASLYRQTPELDVLHPSTRHVDEIEGCFRAFIQREFDVSRSHERIWPEGDKQRSAGSHGYPLMPTRPSINISPQPSTEPGPLHVQPDLSRQPSGLARGGSCH